MKRRTPNDRGRRRGDAAPGRGAKPVYVFCVVKSSRTPAPPRERRKLPGVGKPRAFDLAAGLFVVLADASARDFSPEVLEPKLRDLDWVSRFAVLHSAVVDHYSKFGPVVPMKLFTVFSSELRAKEHIMHLKPRLERVMRRVAGKQEWGVRVRFDRTLAARAARGGDGAEAARSGADFLRKKQRERQAELDISSGARSAAETLFVGLSKKASAADRRKLGADEVASGIVLEASFLVEARAAGAFRTSLDRAAHQLAHAGLVASLSGPWPPYSFVREASGEKPQSRA